MGLGLLTAILGELSFEEVVDYASSVGFESLEVACWPNAKAERRYAGVCHIDVRRVLEDEAYCAYLPRYAREHGIKIAALAFYPNTMDANLAARAANIAHLEKVIQASGKLGVGMVTTFVGRDPKLSVEENMELVKAVWPPLVRQAEECGVKIAIENCPMLFDHTQWPGGQNLMTSPAIWQEIFEIIDSPNFGICFDPSHFVWQMMDYIQPVYDFKDKLFHVHFKDIKLYPEKLRQVGSMAYPLSYMSPKIPGLGDVNWSRFVSALTDIGYRGDACIEIEDRAFEDDLARIKKSIALSYHYLCNYIA